MVLIFSLFTLYAIYSYTKQGEGRALFYMFGMFASLGWFFFSLIGEATIYPLLALVSMVLFIVAYARRVYEVDGKPAIEEAKKVLAEKTSRPLQANNFIFLETFREAKDDPSSWVEDLEVIHDSITLSVNFTNAKVYVPYPGVAKSGKLYTLLFTKGEDEQDIQTLDMLATTLVARAHMKAKGLD